MLDGRAIAEIRARADYAARLNAEEDRDADLDHENPFAGYHNQHVDDHDTGDQYADDAADGD